MRTELMIKGFHCASCKILVEDVCSDFPEIKSTEVDAKTGKVVIEHDDNFDLSKFIKEIESLGEYKVKKV